MQSEIAGYLTIFQNVCTRIERSIGITSWTQKRLITGFDSGYEAFFSMFCIYIYNSMLSQSLKYQLHQIPFLSSVPMIRNLRFFQKFSQQLFILIIKRDFIKHVCHRNNHSFVSLKITSVQFALRCTQLIKILL